MHANWTSQVDLQDVDLGDILVIATSLVITGLVTLASFTAAVLLIARLT